ncbi:hypothetical protein AADEFJLK_00081 [Methylovulum psychrotolerans]|uniref:Uncharacterized protein n=2 Tax=Methylovulum psychrotolerans TaxID=1704499 RepID=A0A2S5CQP5_9GAMM|nr:hypothetical protein AADEFJLK_00081 [Methylovulum psychrotolerans]
MSPMKTSIPTPTDQQLLAELPDFIAVGGLLKATPSEADGCRFLYFQASNEDLDHQNEVVLQQALGESAAYFLRHGNIDLSHYTILGPKSGLANFMDYEIGKPVAVKMDGAGTFVKAQLYQGDSPMAQNANRVWASLTRQTPPCRWYPSVGGAVLSKSVQTDPATGAKVAVIDRVRWNNVALDRCPVNKTIPEVSAAPVGVFAKSLNGFVLQTAAVLPDGLPYNAYREQVARALLAGTLAAQDVAAFAERQWGLSAELAGQFSRRFLTDLRNRRNLT